MPTILAGVTVAEWAADPASHLLPPQRAKAAEVGPKMLAMAHRAHEGGVKIAFGTDTGVSRHGDNAREFARSFPKRRLPGGSMDNSNSGSGLMGRRQFLIAATVAGADNLGKSDMLGSIAPGKYGDLVAVEGDPLTDIRELEDIDFVMKEGVVYKAP